MFITVIILDALAKTQQVCDDKNILKYSSVLFENKTVVIRVDKIHIIHILLDRLQ